MSTPFPSSVMVNGPPPGPGWSSASVTSRAMPMSGCKANAEVAAPRNPISSWVVATASISAVVSVLPKARSTSNMMNTLTRLSKR